MFFIGDLLTLPPFWNPEGMLLSAILKERFAADNTNARKS
jgi:hypothetical protein